MEARESCGRWNYLRGASANPHALRFLWSSALRPRVPSHRGSRPRRMRFGRWAQQGARAGSASSARARDRAKPVGPPVQPTLTPAQQVSRETLGAERQASASMTAADLRARYAVPFRDALPYAPLRAKGVDLLEQKGVAFTPEDTTRLARDGFALLHSAKKQTFALGYADAFSKHLPVYIARNEGGRRERERRQGCEGQPRTTSARDAEYVRKHERRISWNAPARVPRKARRFDQATPVVARIRLFLRA